MICSDTKSRPNRRTLRGQSVDQSFYDEREHNSIEHHHDAARAEAGHRCVLGTRLARRRPVQNRLFNAFSITFPTGERFFIDAVRAFEDDITDPLLREHMKCFIGQEAQHGREHQHYNQTLCQARGYDLARMERKQRKRIEWMKSNVSRYQWLAGTVALEHITALIADGILTNPAWLEGAEPDMAELWRWHAFEETEHKAVTFDVYRAANGWDKTRQKILNVVTFNLLSDVLGHTYYMLKVAGLAHRPGCGGTACVSCLVVKVSGDR